jgi:hypothetical protein
LGGGLGYADELPAGPRVARCRCNTDAQREGRGTLLGESLETLADGQGLAHIRSGEKDDEGRRSESHGGRIAGSRRLQEVPDPDQHLVSGPRPFGEVDIHEEEGEREMVPEIPADSLLEVTHQEATVRKAGERVLEEKMRRILPDVLEKVDELPVLQSGPLRTGAPVTCSVARIESL